MTEAHTELERLAKLATQGEWHINTIKNDGCYGSGEDEYSGFTSYSICEQDGQSLFDTINSDSICVESENDGESESVYAWDDIGKKNAEFVAAANPAAILSLLADIRRLEEEAKRYRFLRDNAFGQNGALALLPPEEMDAAIDKAIESK
jgi:hypothetical protein